MFKKILKKHVINTLRYKFNLKKGNGIRICFSADTYALRLLFTNFKSKLHIDMAKSRGVKKTYLDIGANVGWYSLCAMKAGYERVIAVEANPQTFSSLINNLRVNKLEN